MMILFDLSATQPVTNNDFHGGGEYAKTVFLKLCESLSSDTSLEVFYNPVKNIDTSLFDVCRTKGIPVHACNNNKDISKLLYEKNYTVFYSALPYDYFDIVIPSETEFIYTVHGLRFLEYPADKYELKYKKNNFKIKIKHILFLFFPKIWYKYKKSKNINRFNRLFSLTNNQTIITVSNHSKYSIAYFFPKINNSNIKTLYSPLKQFSIDSGKNNGILGSFSLESEKYILLIGGDRSEKGAYRACIVLNKLIKAGKIPEHIKVLVLGVSHKKKYLRLTNKNCRFEFHDYVSTDDLETFYKNAHLFLYPTMNEGFGYPPMEAMKYGTLCACSANSAVTEVYGDSVLYFNPFDETEMSIRILQSFDNEIRNEKSEKMPVHYQKIRARQEQDLDILAQTILSP